MLGLGLGHLCFLLNLTDFITEYAHLVYLDKLFKINEYEEWKRKNNIEHWYPAFIRETIQPRNRFQDWAIKLFGCPFCFSTFLSLIISVLSGSLFFSLIGLAGAGIAAITFSVESLLYKKINE